MARVSLKLRYSAEGVQGYIQAHTRCDGGTVAYTGGSQCMQDGVYHRKLFIIQKALSLLGYHAIPNTIANKKTKKPKTKNQQSISRKTKKTKKPKTTITSRKP